MINSLIVSDSGLMETWKTPPAQPPRFPPFHQAGFLGSVLLGDACSADRFALRVVVAELMRTVVNRDSPIEVFANQDSAFGHAEAKGLWLDLKPELLQSDCVVIAHDPLVVA